MDKGNFKKEFLDLMVQSEEIENKEENIENVEGSEGTAVESKEEKINEVEEKEQDTISEEMSEIKTPIFMQPIKTLQPAQEVSIISSETVIKGIVKTKGHVRLEGEVDGNLSALGDVMVLGKISGDLEGDNLELVGCNVLGNVTGVGITSIGKDVELCGDVSAQSIIVDGTIKGNVLAAKSIQMSENSIIKGSLTTEELIMEQGAKLNGMVNVGQK